MSIDLSRLRVVVVHCTDGVAALGGNKSISNGRVSGGPKEAKSITRIPGGYLVEWGGGAGGKPGTYVIPDAKVDSVEVAFGDPAAVGAAAPAPQTDTAPASVATHPTREEILAAAQPGDIVFLDGAYTRLPLAPSQVEVGGAAGDSEPTTHTMTRRSRRRNEAGE